MLKRLLPQRRDRTILLPAIGSQLIVTISMFLMPLLIDTLEVHAKLSSRTAGLLLSLELAASALTTLFLSAWARDHSARHWAMAGGLLAIAGTALTLIFPALPVLFASRLLAGIGAGVVAAEATSVLSRGADRERLIALLTIVSIVDAAFWLAVLPFMVDRLGYRAPYICLLLICVAGTYLLRRLPSPSTRTAVAWPASRMPFPFPAALAVAAIFLTQLGQGAFWSMEETYGRNAGFNHHAIGMILSAATLLLLLGAVAAAWAGNQFGRFTSLFALVVLNALSILFAGTIPIHWVFIAANVLQSVTNLSSVIYQLALAASLDRMGRAVAVSTALVTLGNGIGPWLSAVLSTAYGAPSVGVFVLAFNAAALGLYCAVRLRAIAGAQVTASLT